VAEHYDKEVKKHVEKKHFESVGYDAHIIRVGSERGIHCGGVSYR
jgi:hypothetical protein